MKTTRKTYLINKIYQNNLWIHKKRYKISVDYKQS